MFQKVLVTEDLLSKVVTVLELILEKGDKKNIQSYNRDQIKALRSYRKVRTIGYECAGLLKKCLSGHRYKEAVELLWIIWHDVSIHEMFTFKATLIVLNNLPIDENEKVQKIQDFLRLSAKLTSQVNKTETLLEHITYCLSQSSLVAKEKLEEHKTKLKGLENPQMKIMLNAYWDYRKCLDLLAEIKDEKEMNLNEVILNTKNCIKNPGNWDIFVLKLVEVLEKLNKINDIKELLTIYAENHPSHLNAHIYLCLYLHKNDPSSEQLIKHLKEIAKLCPSDERVLLLLKRHKNELSFSKSLNLIFMFLDYPSNADNISAWKRLKKLLKYAKKSEDSSCLESVKTHWVSRHKSWLWMHFNPLQVSHLKESDFALTTIKVKVLSLLDKDHEYILKVSERFKHLGMNSS